MKLWFIIFAVACLLVDESFARRSRRRSRRSSTTKAPTKAPTRAPTKAPTKAAAPAKTPTQTNTATQLQTNAINPQHVQRSIAALAKHVQALQDHMEFQMRGLGDTGIKQVRHVIGGTRPYHSATHASHSIAFIHDHSPNVRTMGMGEVETVMNGVEFRTRHNDYALKMPHKTSKTYNEMQDVPFPPVPPSVLKERTVSKQIDEMKEYFRAFKEQNIKHRDYRPYFKPVLCYMEGSWTNSKGSIEEPFSSDRHALAASTWHDLNQKMRFTEYTGRKERLENYAYLPTKVFGVTNETVPVPVMAQWNYRIACHPLKDDLPLNRFRVVDDMASRLNHWKPQSLKEHVLGRNARFQLDPVDEGKWNMERKAKYGLLDKLMAQIPGKDNYQGNIKDLAFGEMALHYVSKKPLNAAYYHRWFSTKMSGAGGLMTQARGYADANLFVALTSQDKVPEVELKTCSRTTKKCSSWKQRVSYAFPLEIVYMTPLSQWNPYKLEYKGSAWSTEGKTVTAGGRNGDASSKQKAFSGTNSIKYYQTPVEFFNARDKNEDAADTTPVKPIGVLDKNGNVRQVTASGHYITLPEIPGIGRIRQRYPIMPVHGFGSSVWKELEAFKDYTKMSLDD